MEDWPETWMPIPDYEDRYEVSDRGRVLRLFRTRSPKVLKPQVNSAGYLRVALFLEGVREWHFIHRLVLEAFIGPPANDLIEGCHLDDVQTNNRLTNLVWGTRAENLAHRAANTARRRAG